LSPVTSLEKRGRIRGRKRNSDRTVQPGRESRLDKWEKKRNGERIIIQGNRQEHWERFGAKHVQGLT